MQKSSLNTALFYWFLLVGLGVSELSAQLVLNPAPTTREEVRIFYQAVFPVSENVASGWTGNVAQGNEGTTTTAFKNAVYLRINCLRALAGLPTRIVDNATFSAGVQKAALMMSANDELDHTPPTNWLFYSATGANAAGKSNLAFNYGIGAIMDYMEDRGANNDAVGHRRWILYPQTTKMGTGDIVGSGNYSPTNALWVIDDTTVNGPRPTVRDTFVAWPPKGFIPYTLVYPRWSFSYPDADFSNANVSLQRNGANLAVRKETVETGYGENTLVFIPDGLDPNNWAGPVKPANDEKTTVQISNVRIGGNTRSFSYDVTAFDPAQDGVGTILPVITGSSSPQVGVGNIYSVNALTLATGYQWKTSTLSSYNTTDGAEVNGTVTSGGVSGYSFRDSSVKATGSFSYHLAQPNFQTTYFSLNANLLTGSAGTLNFKSRLAYATDKQFAKVQISLNGGQSWETIWTQAGSNGAGEGSFRDRSVSLAAYANKEIQVRFSYEHQNGSAYTQTSAGFGWYVDDISLSGTNSVTNPVTGSVSASRNFTFTPSVAATYGLQVRSQIYGQYMTDWSSLKTVSSTLDGNPPPPANPVIATSGSMAYGSKKVKTKSSRTLSIWNYGNTPLHVTSIKYPSGFTGSWSGTIAPGARKKVKVTFYPKSKKTYKGKIYVRSDATNGTSSRTISGKGK